jgi:hypothetical protein
MDKMDTNLEIPFGIISCYWRLDFLNHIESRGKRGDGGGPGPSAAAPLEFERMKDWISWSMAKCGLAKKNTAFHKNKNKNKN